MFHIVSLLFQDVMFVKIPIFTLLVIFQVKKCTLDGLTGRLVGSKELLLLQLY